jgi:hypothetical protein
MLGILASLAIAGAGIAALVSISFTVRAQARSIGQLLRDSRSISLDREFLVHITGAANSPSPFAPSALVRLRRLPHRAVRTPVTAPLTQREAA